MQIGIALLLLLLAGFTAAEELHAQDWRLSVGYSVEHVDLNYRIHPLHGENPAWLNKGGFELELERYLLYRLYLSGSANILLHNQQTVFLGGPIDYKAMSVGAAAGYQWSRFGLYAGVQAGRMWDLRFRGYQGDEAAHFSPAPAADASTWTTALRGGFKYYLMSNLRLHAELLHNYNRPRSMTPVPEGGGYPEVQWAGFSPTSFRVGLSLSIPWSSRRRVQRINRQGRLPVMMEVAGVSFQPPMETTVVNSPFGSRWGRSHQGVDLQASRGEPILASASGVVVGAGTVSGYGRMVKIRHANHYSTRYAHLHRIRVREGQSVRAGDVIGTAGNSGSATGVHLHFELLRGGVPVDPESYIRLR